jgi:hypothetical protein
MDYDYILNKVFKKAEYFIIKKLKEFKKEERSFDYSLNEISSFIFNYADQNILGLNISMFEKSYRIFNNPDKLYKKGTSISKIIDEEVKIAFLNAMEKNDPVNSEYIKLKNYSFKSFVLNLIIYDSCKRIATRLNENKDLYQLYFESDKYATFTLEAFENHVVKSKIYIELFSKTYPGKKLPILIDSNSSYPYVNKVEENNSENSASNLKNKNNKKDSNQETLEFNLSKITEDEKIFLLHLSLKTKQKIPDTELVKILAITANCLGHSVFSVRAGDNKMYRKFNEGIQYFAESKRRLFINDLISKMDYFKLTTIYHELNKIRRSIK